jgi:hypothetical protein
VVGLLWVAVDRQSHILTIQMLIVSAELQEIGSLDTFAELQHRVLIFGDAFHVVLIGEEVILDLVVALHGVLSDRGRTWFEYISLVCGS